MVNSPYGGELKDLIVRDADKQTRLLEEARSLKQLVLSERQVCDVELLMNGAFSPLTGFLGEMDYHR